MTFPLHLECASHACAFIRRSHASAREQARLARTTAGEWRAQFKLFLLLWIVAASAAPAQDPELPLDGEVFHVGDPVLIEPAEYCGCSEPPRRFIDYLRGPLTDEFFSVGSLDFTTETVRFNVPGEYQLDQFCVCNTPDCVALCPGDQSISHFTVVDSCLEAPPATAPDPDEPQPEIEVSGFLPDDFDLSAGIVGFITLDGSIQQHMPFVIENSGDADLVIKSVYTAFDFDYNHWDFLNFTPYTVVRPGGKYYLYYEHEMTDVEQFLDNGRAASNVVVIESNATENPVLVTSIGAPVFETKAEVPSEAIYTGELPQNPPPPDCADINGDGAIDAADTVGLLLGR